MSAVPDIISQVSGAPLAGRSIVVTRTAEQAGELAEPLRALGAEVITCPVIAIVDPPQPQLVGAAISHLAEYDWVVLTSANAAERFLGHEAFGGAPAAALTAAGTKVAAVGRATAERIERFGVNVDLVPEDYRAEGLVDGFVSLGAGEGWRLLVPRALKAREVLRTQLVPRGVAVDVVPVYETVAARPDSRVMSRFTDGTVDAVTFTSPSTFRNFVEMLKNAGLEPSGVLQAVTTASIGPVTSEAMRAAGFGPTVEAEPYTMSGLVAALVERLS